MDRQVVSALVDQLYLRTLEVRDVMEQAPEREEEIARIEGMIAEIWESLAEVVQLQ